jgi:DNA helicase-2/ATP-dependent DNA helicase PcrA
MDLLAGLNPQQRIAVEHGKGPALVLAGAGSGKTRVIVHRIAYLIQNGATRPERILAVTFTNKAADEMRERIWKLLGKSRDAEPLITTFHSLCVRLLRREIQHLGLRKDFSIYDSEDQKRLIKAILKEFGGNLEEQLKPREALSRISYAKNHMTPPSEYALRFPSPIAEDIQAIYAKYEGRLRQANALDFDDLLLKTVELMTRHPSQRDYYSDWYRHILVDEYQDTNRPQYELLRRLTSAHQNLFVVGDEDQSIYKFRGADIHNILRFEKDFIGARVVKLEQNYRSTQNILRVAGAVVENNTQRKGKILWTENHDGDVITCRRSLSARSEAVWVVRRIDQILQENRGSHVAVLYRANFLSRSFEDVLREAGIGYEVVGSVSFFSRMEVKDMLAYLRVVFNPEDDIALLRVINTPPRGIGATTIEMLTQAALARGVPLFRMLEESVRNKTTGRAAASLTRFYQQVQAWSALRGEKSPSELLEMILNETQYRAMLEKQESSAEAESRVANIEELIRAIAESQQRGETVFEFLDRASLSSELDQADLNARVTLMTLHSAKGLEFDFVFLAGLEEGLFPHEQSSGSPEDLEEERRLCYVGITRARRKLFLTWTPFRRSFGPGAGIPARPSRFFAEMPADLLEDFDLAGGQAFEEPGAYRREEDEWVERRDAEEDRNRFTGQKAYPKSMAELRAYVGTKERQAKPQPKTPTLQAGMRVRHAQFGEGIILRRERAGADIKLVITFSRVGRKTLMEKYAKLEAL